MKSALSSLVLVCAFWTTYAVDTMAIAHAHHDFFNGLTDGSFIHAHNITVVDEVNMRGQPVMGLAGLVALREKYHAAFGDLTFHTDDIIVGPLNAKHEFLQSWNATATHTGHFSGIKPLMKGVTNEFYGVTRLTLNKDGTKIVHFEIMHGTFILEQIGLYNHLVVDTQSLGDKWISFWNHEIDDVSSLVTQDVKMIDDMNMKGVNMESTLTGVEGLKAMRAMYKAGFSNMEFIGKNEATPMVGNKFILTWTFRGTNNGELMGVPPTGKHITHPGANIITMKAGKIAECRTIHSKHMWTELGLFKGINEHGGFKGIDDEIEL